jgi:hypothetical protein
MGKPLPELPGVFQDTERRIEKEGYEKEFEILAFAPMESEDGEFAVILGKDDQGKFTTAVSGIILKRIRHAAKVIGTDETKEDEKEVWLKEPIGKVKFKKEQSQKHKNRQYFVLENVQK